MTELRQPGDLILDHYLPAASAEERETARDNLRRLAKLMVLRSARLARSQQLTRENHHLAVDLSQPTQNL